MTGAGLPGTIANLPTMRRKWLLWQLAGFTGSDTQNHLITFPEFVAHYLLAWSPRVWRACRRSTEAFATTPDARRRRSAPWLNRPWFCNPGDIEPIPANEPALKVQWSRPTGNDKGRLRRVSTAAPTRSPATPPSSPAVAQVLANTPTYMIFDDHEVADDWNLNGRWVTSCLRSRVGPLHRPQRPGRLHADAGMGQRPRALQATTSRDASCSTPSRPPSHRVRRPRRRRPPTSTSCSASTRPTTAQPKRVRFNFTVKAQDHSVVVLDTRTHRDVSNLTLEAPNLVDQPRRAASGASEHRHERGA